jgi:hypothetical protein
MASDALNDRTPPNDIDAEQAVLGACLVAGKILEDVSTLNGQDFYRPAHEQVWSAMKHLHGKGSPVDPLTVKARLTETGEINRVGGAPYLHTLYASVMVASNAGYHAAIVRDRAARRRLIEEHTRGLQDAYSSEDPIEAIVGRSEARLRTVPTAEPDYVGNLMSFDEFCDQPIPEEDWVIPGLLDRGDRLILTGLEGLGKTILMRQLAVAAAAGVHPFSLKAVQPMTVLFVDAENPKKIMTKSFRSLRDAIRRNRGPMDEKRLWIERVPAGLNLGDAKDRLWLQRLVSLVNPDLLCIGPAYKLYRGNGREKDEDLARGVTSALDMIRESVGCALVLEHHSGHGETATKGVREVRPFGSSLWLRWPEFGFGIRPAKDFDKYRRSVEFASWRGPRDERDWPEGLVAGTNFLPWVDGAYA